MSLRTVLWRNLLLDCQFFNHHKVYNAYIISGYTGLPLFFFIFIDVYYVAEFFLTSYIVCIYLTLFVLYLWYNFHILFWEVNFNFSVIYRTEYNNRKCNQRRANTFILSHSTIYKHCFIRHAQWSTIQKSVLQQQRWMCYQWT